MTEEVCVCVCVCVCVYLVYEFNSTPEPQIEQDIHILMCEYGFVNIEFRLRNSYDVSITCRFSSSWIEQDIHILMCEHKCENTEFVNED